MLKSNTYHLHNKAQISPVFKYIFALVAGMIILIFFIKFALDAEKAGGEIVKAEVLHTLDASLQAFSIAESSSAVIPNTPWSKFVHIQYGTKANCGKLTIKDQKFFVPIERVIFGPKEMKAKQIQAWTQSWKFPFRITNIFYLTNSRSNYYLMYNSGNKDFLKQISSNPPSASALDMEHFPNNFEVRIMNSEEEPLSKLKVSDMSKVNYFSSKSGVSTGLKGSYLRTSSECEDSDAESYECYGTVTFFDGSDNQGTLAFIGREMMFGAIMANGYDEYECQYGIALDELKRFIAIYITKSQRLSSKKTGCASKYSSIITQLNNMDSAVDNLKSSSTYTSAQTMSGYAKNIEAINEDDIAGDENCEMVF